MRGCDNSKIHICKKQRDKFKVEYISLLYCPVNGGGGGGGKYRFSILLADHLNPVRWTRILREAQFGENFFRFSRGCSVRSLGHLHSEDTRLSALIGFRRLSRKVTKVYISTSLLTCYNFLSYHQSQSPQHWMIYITCQYVSLYIDNKLMSFDWSYS
jgi:hypothetical protein